MPSPSHPAAATAVLTYQHQCRHLFLFLPRCPHLRRYPWRLFEFPLPPTLVQEDLNALYRQIVDLYGAGQYEDAVTPADIYVAAVEQ